MSQEFYEACIAVEGKRARTVINHILQNGFITTEELSDIYAYDHPPRAARDVRENGIPLKTYKVVSKKTGRKIAAYKFDFSEKTKGRIGGRKAFSIQFKKKLIERYGSCSVLTNEKINPRYLQIDHRIPYEVAGNDANEDVEHYMLLDASEQRAKSWSCESCENFRTNKDKNICENCFWAYPENYSHIAMKPERRLDILWSGDNCKQYELLVTEAKKENQSPQSLIKKLLKDSFSDSN
ncbi:MAG: HNH endonuclease [Gammaproteobacteria bacterium CG11_big_fil_rev_8_21_14_0_20_46_22]|nr:MAG: HNH endonuclease [Gammaproteobacteria bacterium CG12_big_fil_rev_8_21_14_0_65_46_12]PIR11148.1 MAG: HNH endonuclease [Gammaproteobacteria bacterium CG11_big_fil_rev_8_21_14_0_20_46_22]